MGLDEEVVGDCGVERERERERRTIFTKVLINLPLVLTLLCVFFFSIVSATIPIIVTPLNGSGYLQPSTSFSYTFNFSNDSSCSNVLLSYSENITTNQNGVALINISDSSLSGIPLYMCEYLNDSLRKVHNISSQIFRNVTASYFIGDGSQLTGLQTDSFWTNSSGNITYSLGNVGIGTSSPGAKLDVVTMGTIGVGIKVDTYTDYGLYIENTDATNEDWPFAVVLKPAPHITTGKSDAYISWLDSDNSIAWESGVTSSDSFIVYSANSNWHPIHASQSSHPSGGVLQLNAPPSGTGGVAVNFEPNSSTAGLRVWGGGTTPRLYHKFDTTGFIMYDGTSSVIPRIQTTNTPLIWMSNDANQVESGRIRFSESYANYQGSYIYYDGSTNILNFGVHATSDTITANDSPSLSILRSNGNVGIGTTSPGAKLEVSGITNSTSGFAVGEDVGLSANYSVGECWMAYSGGIMYETNCTSL